MTPPGILGTLLLSAALSQPSGDAIPGDDAFVRIDYIAARATYDSLLTAEPRNPQALWRMARVALCMGDVVEGKAAEDLYRRAEYFAKRCIETDSTVAEGHAWYAAALGSIAMYEGGKKKVQLCQVIKQELDRALALNPRDDVAWSILGSFYRALGNVSWLERQLASIFLGSLPDGGYPEAERALLQAIALAPRVMRHHYELGMLYAEWDRPADAHREFALASESPVLLARDLPTRARARDLAAKLAEE
jgi:tetratricopeptide (TPR) repeat protein